ncbi:MAG: hypothetical protein FJ387_11670 [Verrucomicrobia bacterium]|nr:hypothetical protein [Verrucomicrobiota bacterium]
MSTDGLRTLSWSGWAALRQTRFRIHLDGVDEVELTLAEVSPNRRLESVGSGAVPTRWESFSLVFHGPPDRPLPQRTYRFAHEQLSPFELFIVPIGANADSVQYQAVFNRLAPDAAS